MWPRHTQYFTDYPKFYLTATNVTFQNFIVPMHGKGSRATMLKIQARLDDGVTLCFWTWTGNPVQSHLINALKNIVNLEKQRYDCDETMNTKTLRTTSHWKIHIRVIHLVSTMFSKKLQLLLPDRHMFVRVRIIE